MEQIVVTEHIHFQQHLDYQKRYHYNKTTAQMLVKERNIEMKQNEIKSVVQTEKY